MRLLMVGAALFLLLGGCSEDGSGDSGPQDIVDTTAANMKDIESGVLAMHLTAEAEGDVAGVVGFELEGPFRFEENSLPTVEWDLTRFAGEEESTVTFISAGSEAFIEVQGQAYEVTEEQLAELGGTGGVVEGGLEGLEIGDWVEDPSIEDGGSVGGAATDLISGRLNAVAAVNDLLAIAQQVSGDPEISLIEGEDAEHLEQAAESSSIEIYTGKDDRILRRLLVTLALDAEGQDGPLVEGLGDFASARFVFDLEIAEPNSEVSIETPADALPYEEIVP